MIDIYLIYAIEYIYINIHAIIFLKECAYARARRC